MSAPRIRYHLNVRAALVLTALGLVIVLGLYWLSGYQEDRILRSAIAQVRGFRTAAEEEKDPVQRAKDYDLAMRHVNQYVGLRPQDPDGLEIQAELIAKGGGQESYRARPIYERLLRLLNAKPAIDPKGQRAQAARRRLADLEIRSSQDMLKDPRYRLFPQTVFENLRFGVAEKLTDQILDPTLDPPVDDAEAHRLRALALMGQIVPGKTPPRTLRTRENPAGVEIEIRDYAIREFEAALKQDPGDLESAEGLFKLYIVEKKDPIAARKVLDDLLQAGKGTVSIERCLERHDFFKRVGYQEAAVVELKEAATRAPDDVRVILLEIKDALDIRDTRTAHEWLDRFDQLAEDVRQGVPTIAAMTMRGTAEYLDQNPSKALEAWSEGLRLSRGTDAHLTYRLATLEFELGNQARADKLTDQFRRLAGNDSPELAWLEIQQDVYANRLQHAVDRLQDLLSKKPDPSLPHRSDQFMESGRLVLGSCLEKMSRLDEAEKIYRESLVLDPKSLHPRLALAELLAKKANSVIPEGNQAEEEKPEHGKGEKKRPQGKTKAEFIEEAAAVLQSGLEYHPKIPTLLVALTSARFQQQMILPPDQRNWARFDLAYNRASEADPKNLRLDLMRAERLGATDRPDQAILFLRDAVAKNPHSVDYARALADALLRQGHPDQALTVLERAIAPDAAGDRGVLRGLRSRILAGLGRGREARALLVHDLNKLPPDDHGEVWGALLLLLQSHADPLASYEAYLEWARQLPDYPPPKFMLLDLSITARDESKVQKWLAELDPGKLARTPTFQDKLLWPLAQARVLLFQRSRIREKDPKLAADQLEKASNLVRQVLNTSPSNLAALLLKGMILEEEGKKGQAETEFAMAWEGGSPEALLRLINLRTSPDFKPEDPDRNDEIDKLWTNDPTNELARLVAMACYRNGNKDGALRVVAESRRAQKEVRAWQAEMFRLLDDDKQAKDALEKITEQQPKNLEYWLSLIRYQATNGLTKDADETIAKVIKLFQDNRPELVEAQCRTAAGDGPGADKSFEAALRRYPDDREVQLHAEKYYEGTGRLDLAESCLRHVLARDPKDRPVTRQLAIVLSNRPDGMEKALALLRPDGAPNDTPDDRLVRGLVLARSSDATQQKRGVEILDLLVEDLPAENYVASMARAILVQFLLGAGQNERASRIAAISANTGSDPTAIALYAESLIRVGRFGEAESQVDRLLKEGGADSSEANLRARLIQGRATEDGAGPGQSATALEQAYLARASTPEGEAFGREIFPMLVALGPEAREAAERVARRLAEQSEGLSWMPALLQCKQGNREEALALCRAAAMSATSNGDFREVGRVALEVAVGSRSEPSVLEKAEAILIEALKRAPDIDDLHVMRAMINHLQSRYTAEIAIYRDVLSREPHHIVVLNNIAWALSEGVNQPTEGLKWIDELIAVAGGRAEYLDTRGVILLRMGRLDEAIKVFETVVQAEPTGTHLFHLAHAYHKAARDADCRKSFEMAQKAGVTLETVDLTERPSFEVLQKLPPKS